MTIYKPWAQDDCEHCGVYFLVTRTEPKKVDRVICSDCALIDKMERESQVNVLLAKAEQLVELAAEYTVKADRYYAEAQLVSNQK
tara:strand:- start:1958 stop:2212 length:255 start_codon:yes stop_codon:yes gene_type:complete